MTTTDLTKEEILENLEFLSKAELLDIVYDETFNKSYEEINSKFKMRQNDLLESANNEATKELERVEHMNCNELREYIEYEFM